MKLQEVQILYFLVLMKKLSQEILAIFYSIALHDEEVNSKCDTYRLQINKGYYWEHL
ncbi:hypothetical protein D3C85_1208960 [compost metagenome]